VTVAESRFGKIDPLWRVVFNGEEPELRRGRNFFKLIAPRANERCRICLAPFETATPTRSSTRCSATR